MFDVCWGDSNRETVGERKARLEQCGSETSEETSQKLLGRRRASRNKNSRQFEGESTLALPLSLSPARRRHSLFGIFDGGSKESRTATRTGSRLTTSLLDDDNVKGKNTKRQHGSTSSCETWVPTSRVMTPIPLPTNALSAETSHSDFTKSRTPESMFISHRQFRVANIYSL
jgi:hypothetical protein